MKTVFDGTVDQLLAAGNDPAKIKDVRDWLLATRPDTAQAVFAAATHRVSQVRQFPEGTSVTWLDEILFDSAAGTVTEVTATGPDAPYAHVTKDGSSRSKLIPLGALKAETTTARKRAPR
jgi:hypothetical protein